MACFVLALFLVAFLFCSEEWNLFLQFAVVLLMERNPVVHAVLNLAATC